MWRRVGIVGGGGVGIAIVVAEKKRPPEEKELPRAWCAEEVARVWKERPLRCGARGMEVARRLVPVYVRAQFGERKEAARSLRGALTALGPAFVKLGQALSIRPDLLPQEYLDELRMLCDAVPHVPTADAIRIIREELGSVPFGFLDADTPPVAAASLGQVYRCEYEGKTVAVKVQRPNIISAVSLDLTLLWWWAHVVEFAKKYGTRQRPYDVKLVEAFARGAWGELDYEMEAAHQTRMARGLERARSRALRTRIIVPAVRVATRKVLATDWVEGEKLSDAPPSAVRALVPLGVELFAWQLLEFGYYHCDPHVGNLFASSSSSLALIDFGLCCQVAAPNARAMTRAVLTLARGDVPGLLDAAIDLDFLPPDVDRDALLPVLQRVFDAAKLAESSKERRETFRRVSRELNDIFFNYPFRVPEYFALITRALIILEGIALLGDADFDIFQAAYPHALRIFMASSSS
ncbi:hypothetical protein CTAYLR_004119 [Chrysophaeum taylorii]|uniref:ABC1 atypical kinase-like domain-containing protein n=1 Tax=Chrysophaeum taylorii TaxID=2483200 RepID=A0AAD7XNU6_9STRA|nr:hypothetical protein CTAYLR_004119 [Chrysophaeum taylorii]